MKENLGKYLAELEAQIKNDNEFIARKTAEAVKYLNQRDQLQDKLNRIANYIRAHVDEPRYEYNYVAANVLDMATEVLSDNYEETFPGDI